MRTAILTLQCKRGDEIFISNYTMTFDGPLTESVLRAGIADWARQASTEKNIDPNKVAILNVFICQPEL